MPTVQHPTHRVTCKPGPWVLVDGIDQAVLVLERNLREPQSHFLGLARLSTIDSYNIAHVNTALPTYP